MKRTLWNITLASVITLVAYIAIYSIWGAFAGIFKNPSIRLFLIALMTTIVFDFFLIYISKLKKSIGEDEVISDYKYKTYISFVDDFKLVIKRESKTLICIAIVVLICFALNTFDNLIFNRKMISYPTFFFLPTYMFGAYIKVPFIGYALSYIIECTTYIIFLLIYRKKKYDYWTKNKI